MGKNCLALVPESDPSGKDLIHAKVHAIQPKTQQWSLLSPVLRSTQMSPDRLLVGAHRVLDHPPSSLRGMLDVGSLVLLPATFHVTSELNTSKTPITLVYSSFGGSPPGGRCSSSLPPLQGGSACTGGSPRHTPPSSPCPETACPVCNR